MAKTYFSITCGACGKKIIQQSKNEIINFSDYDDTIWHCSCGITWGFYRVSDLIKQKPNDISDHAKLKILESKL